MRLPLMMIVSTAVLTLVGCFEGPPGPPGPAGLPGAQGRKGDKGRAIKATPDETLSLRRPREEMNGKKARKRDPVGFGFVSNQIQASTKPFCRNLQSSRNK